MRQEPNIRTKRYRQVHPLLGASKPGRNEGYFVIPRPAGDLRIIASDGYGWDHVSVSLADRCPTWDEMQRVKQLFWGDDETVVQYHPRADAYHNEHPYCLHLWKRQGSHYELPPKHMIC